MIRNDNYRYPRDTVNKKLEVRRGRILDDSLLSIRGGYRGELRQISDYLIKQKWQVLRYNADYKNPRDTLQLHGIRLPDDNKPVDIPRYIHDALQSEEHAIESEQRGNTKTRDASHVRYAENQANYVEAKRRQRAVELGLTEDVELEDSKESKGQQTTTIPESPGFDVNDITYGQSDEYNRMINAEIAMDNAREKSDFMGDRTKQIGSISPSTPDAMAKTKRIRPATPVTTPVSNQPGSRLSAMKPVPPSGSSLTNNQRTPSRIIEGKDHVIDVVSRYLRNIVNEKDDPENRKDLMRQARDEIRAIAEKFGFDDDTLLESLGHFNRSADGAEDIFSGRNPPSPGDEVKEDRVSSPSSTPQSSLQLTPQTQSSSGAGPTPSSASQRTPQPQPPRNPVPTPSSASQGTTITNNSQIDGTPASGSASVVSLNSKTMEQQADQSGKDFKHNDDDTLANFNARGVINPPRLNPPQPQGGDPSGPPVPGGNPVASNSSSAPGGGPVPPRGPGGPPGPPGFPNAGQMDPRGVDGKNINEKTRDSAGGDKVVDLPSVPPPNDVLRTEYTEADSRLLIPSEIDQIRSDIEFDMFSVVRPGFGLGADNKMFAFENIRDQQVIGKDPLFLPRAYDGPTSGVDTVPLLLQNVLPAEVFKRSQDINKRLRIHAMSTVGKTGKGSLNVLGDDYGQLDSISDRGLNRPPESFLEPIIRIDSRWQRPKLEPGFRSSDRQFRKLYDGLRYPEHVSPHMNMDGGPTMKKARASLEVLI